MSLLKNLPLVLIGAILTLVVQFTIQLGSQDAVQTGTIIRVDDEPAYYNTDSPQSDELPKRIVQLSPHSSQLSKQLAQQTEEATRQDKKQISLDKKKKKKRWVIILGTGRSGSTTLMQMVNAISPDIYIGGENYGFADLLKDTYNHGVSDKLYKRQPSGPWKTNKLDKGAFIWSIQNVMMKALGKFDEENTKIVGFKEIRHFDSEVLNSFVEIFGQDAKFIVNWREDHESQVKSAFYKKNKNAEDTIENKENQLREWSKSQPKDRTFDIPLESFSLEIFNELIDWLGYEGCSFKKILKSNSQGSYKEDSRKDLLKGTCQLKE